MKRALLLVLPLAGCGPNQPDPHQACLDFVEATATSLSKCGTDIDVARAQLNAALGGCSSITSIRDEAELYQDCIPQARGITCQAWTDPATALPPSCAGQFIQ